MHVGFSLLSFSNSPAAICFCALHCLQNFLRQVCQKIPKRNLLNQLVTNSNDVFEHFLPRYVLVVVHLSVRLSVTLVDWTVSTYSPKGVAVPHQKPNPGCATAGELVFLHDFCPKNALSLHNNCPKNIFFSVFLGWGVSYAYAVDKKLVFIVSYQLLGLWRDNCCERHRGVIWRL